MYVKFAYDDIDNKRRLLWWWPLHLYMKFFRFLKTHLFCWRLRRPATACYF